MVADSPPPASSSVVSCVGASRLPANLASESRTSNILDGEVRPNGTFGGCHRAGTGLPGKSEFTASWSDGQIMHNISDVAMARLAQWSPGFARDLHRCRSIMIGRRHHVVIDCPDPAALAAFYSELIGLPVTYASADWVVIAEGETTSGFAFQLAPDHQPPRWPDPSRPQQFHLDVMVDDLADARLRVLALGARRLPHGKHVYVDPAGHPFCLIPRPGWAAPVHADDG